MPAATVLTDINAVIADVILDVRYATTNNFTGIQLYSSNPSVKLRTEPLKALALVADELREQGYQLVIFDAYRPPSVQKQLQSVCTDTNYVAAVSNHCRGITVDVTIADNHGNYADMGTEYDDFTPKAHASTGLITDAQQANRRILVAAMNQQKFLQHPNEWWHFDYEPGLSYDLIDDDQLV